MPTNGSGGCGYLALIVGLFFLSLSDLYGRFYKHFFCKRFPSYALEAFKDLWVLLRIFVVILFD